MKCDCFLANETLTTQINNSLLGVTTGGVPWDARVGKIEKGIDQIFGELKGTQKNIEEVLSTVQAQLIAHDHDFPK